MKKIILASVLAVVALTGCQTTRQNAMTGETETNSTTKGVVVGCLGGAITGALINDGKGAAIGCAAGGAVGGTVGYQMDKQEEMLRQELRNSGVSIKRNGDQIELVLEGDITFATGKSDVSNTVKPAFRSIVKVMNEFEDTNLVISGHTDSKGAVDYNQTLSEVRAKSVQKELNMLGLSRNRTFAEGYGEMSPLCSNDSAEGRACNRRVELIIVPRS